MKRKSIFSAILLVCTAWAAHTGSTGPAQQMAATSSHHSSSKSASTQNPNSDQQMSAHQTLEPEMRQGFWGTINPFARKKYVRRRLSPIRNRVNELDDLTAANAKAIKDVDARAQESIRQATAKADRADQHAIDAGNRAQQANQAALQASHRLNTVEQVVVNIDQYQLAAQIELRLRPGQTVLSARAKQALDVIAWNLKDQKGYIIEVQGFSSQPGQAGIESSQAMANRVLRYLVEKNNVPVYRIFTMGLGNAKLPGTESSNANPAHGDRIDISLLKNNVDQLAMANQPAGEMGATAGTQGSDPGPQSSSTQPAPPQRLSNNAHLTAPATSEPPQPHQ